MLDLPISQPGWNISLGQISPSSHVYVPFLYLGSPQVHLKSDQKHSTYLPLGWKQGMHKWALVSWAMVCMPKLVGGLGLRDPKIQG
jgi:hypothetical protein